MSRATVGRRCAVAVLAILLLPLAGAGHDYPTATMKILHPWVDPVPAGSDRVVLSLRIVEISADDRLIGADTPVAAAVEVVPTAAATDDTADADADTRSDSDAEGKAETAPDAAAPAGIPLHAGVDLVLSKSGPHLLLRGVRRDLPFGYEYPMTLHFERAGAVEAGLIITPDD